jgi:serine/threonine-protein kinase
MGQVAPVPGPVAAQEDPLLGTTIGSFRIVRPLGRGGMGMVYLGENTVIGSKVAVKFLHDHLASNADLVARFYAEARAVNLIGHENIVNIFDMAVAPPNRPYFIMEYLDGPPLSQLANGPVAPDVAIPILMQVCDALQAAHAHGVVHRDLKPENVVLVKRGRRQNFVKVLDFGIAKLFAGEAGAHSETQAGVIVGTPEFMAPEQCTGERVDGRADLYALGVIAYLLATGRLPFEGGGLTGLLLAHREKVPVAPHGVLPQVPLAWSDAIMRALAKRPADRFHDADEMHDALEGVLTAGRPRFTPAPAPPSSATPMPKAPSKVGPVWTVDAPAAQASALEAIEQAQPPSVPSAAKPSARPDLEATVMNPDGSPKCRLRCLDLSRGGFYLCADGDFPKLCSRLKVALDLPGGRFDTVAEVVRHVEPEQAKSWKMPAGFFLTFQELSPALQDAIGRYAKGLPAKAAAAAPERDDPAAERVLVKYRAKGEADPYAMLELAPDAEMSEIAVRGREVRRELELVFERPLSQAQLAHAQAARTQLSAALQTLSVPRARAAYDAERGNYKGVARCITAGLTVTEADALRSTHMQKHGNQRAKSQILLATGHAFESKGMAEKALAAYEEALRVDPLSVELHKRFWTLKRKAPGGRAG